jgi:hypothetical protein
MPSSNIIADVYKKQMVGKRFVYHSKYGGETFGIVRDISVIIRWHADALTNWNLQTGLAKHTTKVTAPTGEQPTVANHWQGWNLDIRIISEKGNVYSLTEDKIYIIED